MSNSDVNGSEQSKRRFRNRLSLRLLNLSTSSSRKLNGQTSTASTISSLGPASPTEPTSPYGPMSIPPISPSSLSFPLSSIRSPLFSTSSVHMNVSEPIFNDALPPTVNELDAEEKAKLLRKTRKLSKVFGQVPSLPQPSLYPRGGISSTSSFHRRSLSSVSTADSQSHHSSRHRQVLRKIPSQPDVRAFISSESHGSIQHPPLPKSPLRASSDSENAPTDPSLTPTTPFTPVQMPSKERRRIRMAKLRRHLGEFNIPPELVTFTPPPPHAQRQEDLRYRKSIDAPARTSSRNFSVKSLRRTRSNGPYTPKSQFDSIVGTPREDAVSFRRRYVQNFGPESRVAHPEEQVYKEKFQMFAESAESQIEPQAALTPRSITPTQSTQDTEPQDVENQSILNVSIADSIGLDSTPKDGSGIVVRERDIDQDSVIGPDPAPLRSTFQERRRRAAKLAQFFGVGYHDISASAPISELGAPPTRPQCPVPAVQVDIRMKSRRFWGGGGDEYWTCNDADMVEVIDKLRDLRA